MAGGTPFAKGKPGRESLSAYERPRVLARGLSGSGDKVIDEKGISLAEAAGLNGAS